MVTDCLIEDAECHRFIDNWRHHDEMNVNCKFMKTKGKQNEAMKRSVYNTEKL
jgi:hypothetical protein